MLSKLFRSRARFDDPDPESRRRAIVGLSEEEARSFQDDLAELARTDADRAVRRAALARVTETAKLEPFVAASDPELARVAAEGIAALGVDPARFSRPEIRNAAIRAARDPDDVLTLLGDVGYDRELIDLAVESRHPRVRLAAASQLMKESSLVELERASRDRDKNVNRLARHRLDSIKQARAEVDKAARRAEDLVRTLATQLPLAERDPLFAAKLGVVRQDWRANLERHRHASTTLASHGVAAAGLTALESAFATHLSDAEARLAALPARATTPAAGPPGSAAASGEPPVTATAAFNEALTALEDLLGRMREGRADAIDAYAELHAESLAAQDRWLATADHEPPPEVLAARFHGVAHALRLAFDAAERATTHAGDVAVLLDDPLGVAPAAAASTPEDYEALWQQQRQSRAQGERITRLLARIDWPAEAALPARLAALAARRDRLAAFDAELHRLHDELAERVRQDIDKLATEIETGNLSAAAAVEAEVRRLLKSLPAGSAKRLQGEFNHLAARVQELKDWVTYATHPKREEYVAEMEALAAAPLEPPEQAERIKALRASWKALGPVTSSPDHRLFDRFNAAAERAFEPCRVHFERQSERRKFNLEQRRKICEDLTLYLDKNDWSRPDWRAAERILQVARDEWRKFHPVDRSPGRKLETRFEALTTRLHELIKAEWDRNVAAKQAIVAEAAAARDAATDLREATEQIKTLQRRWREVGVTPRRVDQRLWRDFRAICDEVFGRREAVRTERREAIGNQVSRAEQVLDQYAAELEEAQERGAEPDAARQFAEQFHAIGELPRDAARRLEARFRELDKAYRVLLRHTERRRVTGGVDRLERLDGALAALELDFFDGTIDAATAESRLATLPGLDLEDPGPFAHRIARLRQMLTDATRRPDSGTLAARRTLTIEMEVVAGLDTPAEDQSRRLALQVERLNRKQRQPLDDDPLRMAERFCDLGPLVDDNGELRERFFQACREALR
jgi:exonuclease SbcC